jgi:uncharacterized protein
VRQLFTGLRLANRRLLLPSPIVAEVGYLLGAKAGARTEAFFLRARLHPGRADHGRLRPDG